MTELLEKAFPGSDSSILPVYHIVVEEIIFSVLKDLFDIDDKQLERLKSELDNLFSPGAKSGNLPVFAKLIKAFILKNRAEFEAVVQVLQQLPAEFQTREFFNAFLTSLQNAYDAFSSDEQQKAVSALLVHVGANYGATAGKNIFFRKIVIFILVIIGVFFLTSNRNITTVVAFLGIYYFKKEKVEGDAVCAKSGKELYAFETTDLNTSQKMYFLLQPFNTGYLIIYLQRKFGFNENDKLRQFLVKDEKKRNGRKK